MEVKAKKAKQESNGKRQDERTHNERNRNKEWDTENDKKERETKTIDYSCLLYTSDAADE